MTTEAVNLRSSVISKNLPAKIVGNIIYLHRDTLEELLPEVYSVVSKTLNSAFTDGVPGFNVIKIEESFSAISLLDYPELYDDPFPALSKSWKIDAIKNTVGYRTYSTSLNPPILHRKELLIGSNHKRYEEYKSLTDSAELLGLFQDTKRIGYKRQWNNLIRDYGYRIDDHCLLPIGNEEIEDEFHIETAESHKAEGGVFRHLTALNRSNLSAPIQTLGRYGYLNKEYKIFDYGCGLGTDISALETEGINAHGWDPFYAANNKIYNSEIVNLGFVINVIEDFDERIEALKNAWSLAERLLVVSVMLEHLNRKTGQVFRDGVISSRNTFQKYYSQSEVRSFVDEVLDVESIPVAPGILYIFRDKDLEQDFLLKRYSRNRYRSKLNPIRVSLAPRVSSREKHERFYSEYRELLDGLWSLWLELGRRPEASEVSNLSLVIEVFGSIKKALNFLERFNGSQEINNAVDARLADLEVYFALGIFEQRSPYKVASPRIRNDIKSFFGSIRNAKDCSTKLLYQLSDIEQIEQACVKARDHGLGWLEEGVSLQLHSSMIEQLPAVLRVYIGCASAMYGDYKNADLVKIHINSGKLTLMSFDDFEGKALPRMLERVKIKFREQDIEYFDYVDEHEPPYLYFKSRYINEEFPKYPEQVSFEEQLDELKLFDFWGYGHSPSVFEDKLKMHRLEIDGYDLVRSESIPDLDESCGKYLTFRQLIECGETFNKISIANLPKHIETYNSLFDLATKILDPVIEYFGMIKLTYGFCSSELAKQIPGKMAPKLDQHASCEINRNGKYICDRLGAAVDFIVEDEDMLEVAQWITVNVPFDRLYFYGTDKPIHVSYGPDEKREIVIMSLSKGGRLIPKVVKNDSFVSKPLR